MKASIVIPTRNRRKILERTLQYLFLQDYPQDQYEIIVIDDGSTDGTHA
ncbi:MAG: glycosyltransferase, partial [Clostridia bacterium]|nr:glycosyltransferase [Clostridia bacterium]